MPNGEWANDYQDDLVDCLKRKGAIEGDGKNFVEEWRRNGDTYRSLHRGWKRIEALGVGDEWAQMVISLLGPVSDPPSNVGHKRKSIAIVGAGTAGLAMLKTLLDLPERDAWDIVLFEERENVGGVWLPDPHPEPPPTIPKAPLYPAMHTNIPVPSMTYPNFPYPVGTHLFPSHEHVESYLVSYAHHYGLLRYIRFNHRVLNASWSGTPEAGIWNITFLDCQNEIRSDVFEHLVDATGNNRTPQIPSWPGQDEWLADGASKHGRKREIIHSAWYRRPETYANKSILIVGDSASGRDVTTQTAPVVSKVYVSTRNTHQKIKDIALGHLPPNAIRKPEISHFTRDSIVFIDDTEIADVDSIILATGYQLRKPFLEAGHALAIDSKANSNNTKETLVCNTRYIYPLYKHIFSLSPMYPTTALSFVGLPIGPASFHSDVAQSIFIAYNIRESRLPTRQTMLHELEQQEQALKAEEIDPYTVGHRVPRGSDYQDGLVDYLKQKGAIQDDGKNFVEEWRRKDVTYFHLQRGWKRIKALGVGDEWVKGVSTEEQWSDLMDRVNAWQKEYEEGTAA
ncbi:hypothetical protein APHAL10511_007314 [Amanita phalloides]|nr:hypothetical protein APHAL10511_007314 [Amanita phalloides]